MNLIDLGVPTPRTDPQCFEEFLYEFGSVEFLPPPPQYEANFFEVVESRASRRRFEGLAQDKLSAVLWYSAKRRDARLQNGLPVWQHAPTPSAGGCHPIDIFITRVGVENKYLWFYDPVEHVLRSIVGVDSHRLDQLSVARKQVLDAGIGAAIIWFAAQPERTHSRYINGDSLIWRDSGALLATIGLVARALDINCCALGITGQPYISDALQAQGRVVGVGGCIIGGG